MEFLVPGENGLYIEASHRIQHYYLFCTYYFCTFHIALLMIEQVELCKMIVLIYKTLFCCVVIFIYLDQK